MRPKVILGVLLLAALLTAGLILASRGLRPASLEREPAVAAAATERGASPPVITAVSSGSSSNAGPSLSAPPPDPGRVSRLRQRTAELNALAMKDDIASRDAILAELQNPDPEIRKAALEAAIQFGDRSVVPRLQEVAAQTEDPEEKAEILAAIEFINLPSLTEFLADQNAKRAAMGLTNSVAPPANRVRRPHSPTPAQSTQP